MPLIGQPVQFHDLSDPENPVTLAATVLGVKSDGSLELSVQQKGSAGNVVLALVTAAPESVTTFEPAPEPETTPEPKKTKKAAE